MTRSRTIMALAAATIGLALAYAPAALADDMSKSDNMGKMHDNGMKKDTMSHDSMSKGGMKKDDMSK